jgi:hypothetical protein
MMPAASPSITTGETITFLWMSEAFFVLKLLRVEAIEVDDIKSVVNFPRSTIWRCMRAGFCRSYLFGDFNHFNFVHFETS